MKPAATRPTDLLPAWAGLPIVALVVFSLLSGVVGGLIRAGVPLFQLMPARWVLPTASLHAALMIGGLLGTVISIERAVALRRRWAWLSPLMSASAALALVGGNMLLGLWLNLLASAIFLLVNLALWLRQRAWHTTLLCLSAVVWLLGNLTFFQHGLQTQTLLAWLAFLIITIVAERLDMARLTRKSTLSGPLLAAGVAMLLAGTTTASHAEAAGCVLYGTGLLALATWLLAFDVARHTIHAHGLSRYMAVCLLSGYGWLAVSGLSWIAVGTGHSARDAALHALALGFVISMVMGHAPVILPAVARIKLHFDGRFYAPLAALHLSLAVRLLAGYENPLWFQLGCLLNALTLLLFAITAVSSAWSHRRNQLRQIKRPRPMAKEA